MKQVFRMFLFDMKLSLKSFMGAYIATVPLVILVILRLFLPSVEDTTVTIVAVTEGANAVRQEVVDRLGSFAEIRSVASVDEMEQRLKQAGTAEGLYWDPAGDRYTSVLERTREDNTVFSHAARFLRQDYHRSKHPEAPPVTTFVHGIPDELSERTKTSPVATIGGSIFVVFIVIVAAFFIGMSVVDDKDHGTILAIRLTPISKADYFLGRSIFPFLVTVFYTLIGMLMLGLIHVSILQVYLVVLAAFSVTLVTGLLIGAVGANEVEAIGVGKVASMFLLLPILGATLLPEVWHWVVWWAPTYWLYDMLEEVFTETAVWGGLAWKCAVMIAVTGIYFALLRKKIVEGLS